MRSSKRVRLTSGETGQITSGINRVECNGDCAGHYDTLGIYKSLYVDDPDDIYPESNEVMVKDLCRWPVDDYYNIWIVHKIGPPEDSVKGFAYLPGVEDDKDGAVILYSAFGIGEEFNDILRPETRYNRTITHQSGHYLNLYDTYEGDNNGTQCPPNNNCNLDGDKCCDTPPHIRSNGDCNPSGTNSCANDSSNVYFVHNYMDASSEVCKNEFTVDQSVRMWDLLDHGLRSTFKESNGCGNVYSPPPSCGCNLIQNWNFEIFTTNNPADPNTPESENLEDIAFWDKFSNTPWYCYMGDNTYVGVKNESFISSMPLVNLEYDKKYELNYKYSVQRLNDIIPPLYTDIVIRFRLVTLRQNGTIQSSILLPASSPMYYDYPSSAGFPTYSDYFCYPNQYEEDNPNIDFTMYWNNVSSQFLSETTDGPFYLLCEVFYNDDKASIYFDDITFCDCPSLCVGTPQLDFSQNECTVQFSASSTADPDESEFAMYSWDFGDGSPIETGQNVTHDYMWDGTYTVCLTMDCGDDIKGPVCQEITVSSDCDSCTPYAVDISVQQCSDGDSYLADFYIDQIPDGYKPCNENGQFMYSDQADIQVNSYYLDENSNNNTLYISINITPYGSSFGSDITSHIMLCSENGSQICYYLNRPMVGSQCENCDQLYQYDLYASCNEDLSSDNKYVYGGSYTFPQGTLDCTGSSKFISDEAGLNISQNGNAIDYYIVTTKDHPFIAKVMYVCTDNDGNQNCLSFNIQVLQVCPRKKKGGKKGGSIIASEQDINGSKPMENFVISNPVSDILYIYNKNFMKMDKEVKIDILDQMGKMVLSKKIIGYYYRNSINLSGFNQGIYFIRFNVGTEIISTKKFVVIK